MSNKVFIGIIAFIIAGTIGYSFFKKSDRPPAGDRPGFAHEDKGRKHVEDGSVKYGGPQPPTSGDHSGPAPWQVYNQEVPDINIIHNLEHGGIYVSYQPGLSMDQVAKLNALFSAPFSRAKFTPSKALVAPRAANDAPIIISSWNRSLKLQQFDEEKLVQYYLRNVGKAPEGGAS